MVPIILTALIAFFVSSLFGYVVHRSLHSEWTGPLNKKHMTHHLLLYPPTDYLSDKYREAGKDNTLYIFGAAAIPLVATPIVLGVMGVLALPLVITALVVMGLMGFLHSYLHDSFHIRNHWLYKVPVIGKWFSRWVHLHYLHHVDMQTNFGIFLFHWDHVMRTYWNKKD